jgi:uncharacterized phage protein gp47/JayE
MPIIFDTSLEAVIQRIQSDVQNSLTGSNPFLRASFLKSLSVSTAGRTNDFYLQGNLLETQLFPDTATGDFLLRWGSYKDLQPYAATQAAGDITISGTPGTIIAANTIFQSSNNLQYQTLAATTIETLTEVPISSITLIGTIATVTTVGDHNLATNSIVTISGADQDEYNITGQIQVVALNQFTYTVVGSPISPATGSIVYSATFASALVQSIDFGFQTNQPAGAALNFQTPIPGVSTSAYVQFSQISGGFDAESDASFRARVITSYHNPEAQFNAYNIIATAMEIPGVTRVWVEEITPEPGQVTVYFVEDNNASIIPPAQDVENVFNALVAIAPSNTYPGDIFVNDPLTPVEVNFVFTELSPNTDTMQAAIVANLKDYFTSRNAPGVTVPAYAYTSAIYQTIDTATGNFVQTFILSEPVGDITITTGQIAVFGSVTFP